MRLKLLLFFFCILLASAGAGVLSAEEVAPMPRQLGEIENALSAWASADALIKEDGSLTRGLIPESFRTVIERQLATSSSDCTHQPELVRVRTPRTSLPSAVQLSSQTFVTTITGTAVGYYHTVSGTLFRAKITQILRGNASVGNEIFFFLPVGDFAVGETRICRVNSAYPAHLPETGDQALILLDAEPFQRGYFAIPGSSGLVVFDSTGSTYLPRQYQVTHPEQEGMQQTDFLNWLEKEVR